jgi:hypothetical protein
MKKFKIPFCFLLLCSVSAYSFSLQDSLFGHLENVTSLIQKNEPIKFTKKLFFPTRCNLSLNGWGKSSEDFAADEYLKITEIKALLHSDSQVEEVLPAEEHLGAIYFDLKKGGELEIAIQRYERPTKKYIETVDVDFFCKGPVQYTLLIASFVFMSIGFAGFIITLIQSIRRKS